MNRKAPRSPTIASASAARRRISSGGRLRSVLGIDRMRVVGATARTSRRRPSSSHARTCSGQYTDANARAKPSASVGATASSASIAASPTTS